jgi:hypothetical protein
VVEGRKDKSRDEKERNRFVYSFFPTPHISTFKTRIRIEGQQPTASVSGLCQELLDCLQ